MKITTLEGRSHFDAADFTVNVFNGNRTKSSIWYKESVIYHEFGHAIDWQRNLKANQKVIALMDKYRDRMMSKDVMGWVTKFDSKEGRLITTVERGLTKEISHISRRLRSLYERFDKMDNAFFTKRGIVKKDVLEQIMAASDTIQSLNPTSGMGHGISYMIKPGNAEAEFIAHCFENAFIGNQIFKKYMPELYDDMIKLVKELN